MDATLWLKIKGVILDILFPPICLACEAPLPPENKARQLCAACFSSIHPHNTMLCAACGARLPENKKVCHRDMPYILAAAAPYKDDVVQELIHALKYRALSAASVPLAHIMLAYLRELEIDFSKFVIVPVPLHSTRKRMRGFNQSELLAEKIAAGLGLPLVINSLARPKNTKPQAEMENKKSRLENLAGCFALRNDALRGAHILLIDDVHTTGATMREAVNTLRLGGAKKVIPLVAARA